MAIVKFSYFFLKLILKSTNYPTLIIKNLNVVLFASKRSDLDKELTSQVSTDPNRQHWKNESAKNTQGLIQVAIGVRSLLNLKRINISVK